MIEKQSTAAQAAHSAQPAYPTSDVQSMKVEEETNHLKNTPFLPDEIFDTLPDFLKQGCDVFSDSRERDVFLTGALAVLSGSMPNVTGIYDKKTTHTNLFAFIIAPAASGKGVLSFARDLGMDYHNKLLEKSQQDRRAYESTMTEYRKAQLRARKKGLPFNQPVPVPPKFSVLFLPANSSSASVIQNLSGSNGTGIILETEADTLGNAFKQDWSSYSDMLRKAFHHEPISYSRKTNFEFLEIPAPKLSVAISGTPGQVQNLISSAEDGLFSRFMFYCFKGETTWRDVSPGRNGFSLTRHFAALSKRFTAFAEFLAANPTTFNLQPHQWKELNSTFDHWLKDSTVFVGDGAVSFIKRLGLITFRMAMILTALRKAESQSTDGHLEASDNDFQTALALAEVYRQHTELMFLNLPATESEVVFKYSSKKKDFFEALPPAFARKEAIKMAESFGFAERTVDKYLKQFQEAGYLTKSDYGEYTKI